MSSDLESNYDKIYRYCYFHLHERELAEDITQDVFLRYFSSCRTLDSLSMLKYLYTIARNLCIDEYRKKGRCQEENYEEPPEGQACADSEEEQTIVSYAVRKALEEMEKEEQELLLLRYVNEMPLAVIGQVYGISRFAAYRKLRFVREKFREKLRKEGLC